MVKLLKTKVYYTFIFSFDKVAHEMHKELKLKTWGLHVSSCY